MIVVKKSYRLILLISGIGVLCAGCCSTHISLVSDNLPLNSLEFASRRTDPGAFPHMTIVFNPSHKVQVARTTVFDYLTDTLPDHENLICGSVDDGYLLMDSYVQLASWCQFFKAMDTPFVFALINRTAQFNPRAEMVSDVLAGLSLGTLPFPGKHHFRCEQNIYLSFDQGGVLEPLSSDSRFYGAKGESYKTIFTPFGIMIPKYREYKKISLYVSETHLSTIAHSQFKTNYQQHALSEIDKVVRTKSPRSISEDTFQNLVRKAFGEDYTPDKAYRLTVTTLGGAYASSVNDAQTSIKNNRGEVLLMKPGHLYVTHIFKDSDIWVTGVSSRSSTIHLQTFELGPVTDLAPVLAAWLVEAGRI